MMIEGRTQMESWSSLGDVELRHDLLTPVNQILGYGEMLQEEAADLELPELSTGSSSIVGLGKSILAQIHRVHVLERGHYPLTDLQELFSHLPPLAREIGEQCVTLRNNTNILGKDLLSRDLSRIQLAAGRLEEIVEKRVGHLIADSGRLAN